MTHQSSPSTACSSQPQLADLAPTIANSPQAQGDLLVLPWPSTTASQQRAAAVAAGAPIPRTGTGLAAEARKHELHAAGPGVTWTPEPVGSGLTLGTLTVPDEAVAILGHDEHADLHIGPGVYVIRRQRAHPITAPALRPAPAPEPDYGIDAWTLALD